MIHDQARRKQARQSTVIAEGGHIDGMSTATEPSTEEESDCKSTAVPDVAWRLEDSSVSSMEISDDR
jgi:hypothetical protein